MADRSMADKLNKQILELMQIDLECEAEVFIDVFSSETSNIYAYFLELRGDWYLKCV